MDILEVKERFIELRAKGWSFDKIAKELGKAKQTLIDWSKDLDSEIANFKAMELEALYEKHFLLKESRVETLGVLLQKVKAEVMSRDLSDVPTDKLLNLLLKYQNQVKEEVVSPIYKTSEDIKEDKLDKILLNDLTNMKPERRLKVG